ncbi:hypothetical protein [Aquidulcibacter sp.]|jgi:hypothetical protein|uniref:hypothetical protein n=1 Tax=Aquidulcibacter sp. TaxID=2052990 RepID=UPI0037BFCB6F
MTPQKLSDYLAKPVVLGGCLAFVWLASLISAVALSPAADIAWRYFIAGGILEGKTLYRDVIDLNPPLWFWAAIPSVWIGNVFGAGAHIVAMSLAHLSCLIALWMFAKGIDGILSKSERGFALVGFLVAILWVAVADVGQREQSVLIASVLWLVLALRRDAQLPVSLGLAVSIACFSAYGFALKHYFVLIPLAVELVLALRLGKKWRPFRPETLVLGGLAIGYALLVFFFAQDFLAEIVPVAALSYDAFNAWTGKPAWYAILMVIGPAQFLLVPLVLMIRLRDRRPIILGLFGLCFLFLIIIIGQMKGFFYHYIALKGVSILILVLWLGREAPMAAIDKWLVRLGLVGFFFSMIISPLQTVLKEGATPVSGNLLHLIRAEPPSNRIMILSTVPQNSFLVLAQQGRSFGARHYSMWMVPGLMVQGQNQKTADAAKAQLARVRREYLEDIQCFAPTILISQKEKFKGQKSIQTEGMAFLREDPTADRWMADHYRLESRLDDFQVWRQMKPIGQGANCPSKSR